MNKMWTLGGLLLVFSLVIIYFFLTQFKIVNFFSEGESQIVLPNKIWKIHFSEKIDSNSMEPSFIYVTNDKGEKQENEIILSDDQKTIYISPPENGYDSHSKSYTLHVKKGLKSTLGRGLLKSEKLLFIVKETLPIVDSKTQLNGYFLKMLKEQKHSRSLFGFGNSIEKKESSSDMANSGSGTAKQDISETNVQVQGVDEADMVKTDGKHIFQASNNKVDIISAVPAGEMKRLATITYDTSFSPYELFLYEDQLLVIGHSYDMNEKSMNQNAKKMMIAPMHQSTKAIVYDIKNPLKPKEIREVNLEGSYVSSRKMKGIVYLVTNHQPDFWLLENNESIDIRPKFSDTSVSSDLKAVDYDKIQYFPDSEEPNYTMIAAFDLGKPKKEATITTYLGSGSQLYMSKENLYFAVPNQYLQPIEDMNKRLAPDTNIYKFSVKGMEVNFHSSAEISGTVLNQFSMDEYDGYFRLVTTKGYAWDESQPSSNQLYILDENLKQVGQLEELARGERIYSARFMGARIYMVTFKETDPLFVIDASEPTNPKVLGELKIPGFSNYLHPYDENHIIGFGQDTKIVSDKNTSDGPRIITDGVKISMFDVSNMSNPKEKFTEIIGGRGTYSPLNHDHKALLFNKHKDLFAFPITVYRNHETNEYEQILEYQGAFIYGIDLTKGFTLKSKITHETQKSVYEDWENGIGRLIYIGETLYALSPTKITAHQLTDFTKVGELSLR